MKGKEKKDLIGHFKEQNRTLPAGQYKTGNERKEHDKRGQDRTGMDCTEL